MITWLDIWERSEDLAAQLQVDQRVLTIPSLPIGVGLLLLVAGLRRGLDICFDEKGIVPGPSPVPPRAMETFLDWPRDFSIGLGSSFPEELKHLAEGRTFHFATSGSTGEPRLIPKPAQGLLAEVRELSRIYDMRPGQQIVSLVRPFHIYGFLHSFLLPIFNECSLQFFVSKGILPSAEDGLPSASDLLIMVPAHWHLLTHIQSFHRCRTLVSSGGPFGPERQEELLQERASERAFEILGSTETGGIGYRRLDEAGSEFQLFPGIRLETLGEGTKVHSPFLDPEPWTISADRLQMLDDRHFRHAGRSDRIFKYAGQRYSLGEVEERLRSLTNGAEIRCIFREMTSKAQGGVLYAWIEGDWTEEALAALRAPYEAGTACPFPHVLRAVREFSRDAQGKVSTSLLK